MKKTVLLVLITACGACKLFTPTMSTYDQNAYSQTTSLKVDALNIMDSAVESYDVHKKSVAAVNTSIQKLYSYEKNLPKNEITAAQWKIITDTTGNLWGGFLVRWRKEKTLHKAFIDDEKTLIGDAFDQVAELESRKIKAPTK
jgi:hypothetical protein